MIIQLNSYALANQILSDCQASYSYSGALSLAEFFDEHAENEEFDAVAIRCDWSEYKNAIVAAKEYGWKYDEDEDEDEDEKKEKSAMNFLEHNTIVLVHDSGIMLVNF